MDRNFSLHIVPGVDFYRAILRRTSSFTTQDWNVNQKNETHCYCLLDLRHFMEHSHLFAKAL